MSIMANEGLKKIDNYMFKRRIESIVNEFNLKHSELDGKTFADIIADEFVLDKLRLTIFSLKANDYVSEFEIVEEISQYVHSQYSERRGKLAPERINLEQVKSYIMDLIDLLRVARRAQLSLDQTLQNAMLVDELREQTRSTEDGFDSLSAKQIKIHDSVEGIRETLSAMQKSIQTSEVEPIDFSTVRIHIDNGDYEDALTTLALIDKDTLNEEDLAQWCYLYLISKLFGGEDVTPENINRKFDLYNLDSPFRDVAIVKYHLSKRHFETALEVIENSINRYGEENKLILTKALTLQLLNRHNEWVQIIFDEGEIRSQFTDSHFANHLASVHFLSINNPIKALLFGSNAAKLHPTNSYQFQELYLRGNAIVHEAYSKMDIVPVVTLNDIVLNMKSILKKVLKKEPEINLLAQYTSAYLGILNFAAPNEAIDYYENLSDDLKSHDQIKDILVRNYFVRQDFESLKALYDKDSSYIDLQPGMAIEVYLADGMFDNLFGVLEMKVKKIQQDDPISVANNIIQTHMVDIRVKHRKKVKCVFKDIPKRLFESLLILPNYIPGILDIYLRIGFDIAVDNVFNKLIDQVHEVDSTILLTTCSILKDHGEHRRGRELLSFVKYDSSECFGTFLELYKLEDKKTMLTQFVGLVEAMPREIRSDKLMLYCAEIACSNELYEYGMSLLENVQSDENKELAAYYRLESLFRIHETSGLLEATNAIAGSNNRFFAISALKGYLRVLKFDLYVQYVSRIPLISDEPLSDSELEMVVSVYMSYMNSSLVQKKVEVVDSEMLLELRTYDGKKRNVVLTSNDQILKFQYYNGCKVVDSNSCDGEALKYLQVDDKVTLYHIDYTLSAITPLEAFVLAHYLGEYMERFPDSRRFYKEDIGDIEADPEPFMDVVTRITDQRKQVFDSFYEQYKFSGNVQVTMPFEMLRKKISIETHELANRLLYSNNYRLLCGDPATYKGERGYLVSWLSILVLKSAGMLHKILDFDLPVYVTRSTVRKLESIRFKESQTLDAIGGAMFTDADGNVGYYETSKEERIAALKGWNDIAYVLSKLEVLEDKNIVVQARLSAGTLPYEIHELMSLSKARNLCLVYDDLSLRRYHNGSGGKTVTSIGLFASDNSVSDDTLLDLIYDLSRKGVNSFISLDIQLRLLESFDFSKPDFWLLYSKLGAVQFNYYDQYGYFILYYKNLLGIMTESPLYEQYDALLMNLTMNYLKLRNEEDKFNEIVTELMSNLA